MLRFITVDASGSKTKGSKSKLGFICSDIDSASLRTVAILLPAFLLCFLYV